MIDLHLIGIGTGNPDHLTAQGLRAMNAADLILLPRKGAAKADLADLRRTICDTVLTSAPRIVEFDMPVRDADADYADAVDQWHDAIAAAWQREIAWNLPQGGHLALLVWGDPTLYDSTLRIAGRLKRAGLALNLHVVPGITSLQALTAAHAVPLNPLAGSFTVTTGRALRRDGWPQGADTVAVMLDSGCAFDAIDPAGVTIWWGAYLGMAQQALDHGPLSSAAPRIAATRAALRKRNGWIMDIYLMRKDKPDAG